jgi:ABC-2 type transport system permease protein
MKTLLIAKKYTLEILREWQLILLVLLLPVVFLLITYFAYPGNIIKTFDIHVQGNTQSSETANQITKDLSNIKHANGLNVSDVHQEFLSEAEITELIEDGTFALSIWIDETSSPISITILGDPLSNSYYQAVNALEFDDADQMTMVESEIKPLYQTGPITYFEQYAPGMIVFAIMLLTLQTALLITREIKSGSIQRYKLSGLGSTEIVFGIAIAQFLIVILQIIVITVLSLWMGFRIHGSIALGLLNIILLALAAIGQGIIIGCFLENESQAATIGAIVPMVQVFISGAFFEMPAIRMFSLGKHTFNLFDIFPATESMQLFSLTLSNNAPIKAIQYPLLILILLTSFTYLFAMIFFKQNFLKA